MGLQFLPGPDSGQQKQVRGVDRTAGQNHLPSLHPLFAPAPGIRHADRPLAGKQHPRGPSPGDYGEVGAIHRRAQIHLALAPAPAVLLRHLVKAHPFLAGPVKIVVAWVAGLNTRLHKRQAQWIGGTQRGHVQGPVHTVIRSLPALSVFGSAKIGQQVRVSPPRVTHADPVVVVPGVAPGIAHGIGGTAAAQGLAARPEQAPAVQVPLGGCVILPVEALAPHQPGNTEGHVDQRMGVRRAAFQQADPCAGLGRKPLGQKRSRRSPPPRSGSSNMLSPSQSSSHGCILPEEPLFVES